MTQFLVTVVGQVVKICSVGRPRSRKLPLNRQCPAVFNVQNGKFSRLGNDSPPYPHLSFITDSTHHSTVAVMVPEKNCWMRARAATVPTVSGVQESLQTMPIVLLPKKSKKKIPNFMKCRRCMEI